MLGQFDEADNERLLDEALQRDVPPDEDDFDTLAPVRMPSDSYPCSLLSGKAVAHRPSDTLRSRTVMRCFLSFLTGALLLGSAAAQPRTAPAYDQPYRPQVHFSPQKNWTNDPNGLVYFEGEYHLFFQYNPFGDKWGHMSWGHAVSPDLMHWTELPVALREENGVMIFTGSTVVDERNTSGFCRSGKPCLVAIYTGHTPESKGKPALQTQNVAYSNDRGRTWTKFSGNPVLDLHLSDFRDPKVFWYGPSKHWVMGVALPNDHKVKIYNSTDLKHWTPVSEFGPAGATSGQWECPELFELPLSTTGGPKTRWVMKVGLNPGALQGGSGEQYFTGSFDGKRFTNDNLPEKTLWTDYGKDCYCALTFNHLPPNQTPVMLGWMSNWQYAAELPTHPWRGQMTIPRKLSLFNTADGVRLRQEPTDRIVPLRRNALEAKGKTTALVNKALGNWRWQANEVFELEAEIDPGPAGKIALQLVAKDGGFTAVSFDAKAKKLSVDRTHSGLVGFEPRFPSRTEAPFTPIGSLLRLRILVDRNSWEVFVGDGQLALTNLVFPKTEASSLRLTTEKGDIGGATVRLWPLASTHEER